MFFINVDEVIVEGAIHETLSPSKKAIERCERINWFLYRSDYATGEKDWNNASPKVREEILDGILKYVLCLENNRSKVIMSIASTPYMRRTRYLV